MIIDYEDLENHPISAAVGLRADMLDGVGQLEDYILSRSARDGATAYEVLGGVSAQPPDPYPTDEQPGPNSDPHTAQQLM
jgi:hypothetical protein